MKVAENTIKKHIQPRKLLAEMLPEISALLIEFGNMEHLEQREDVVNALIEAGRFLKGSKISSPLEIRDTLQAQQKSINSDLTDFDTNMIDLGVDSNSDDEFFQLRSLNERLDALIFSFEFYVDSAVSTTRGGAALSAIR